jgi:limonene-1,2-epoxide hydrolase
MFFWLAMASVVAIGGQNTSWASAQGAENVNNEQIVRDFIAAWSRLDADELVTYFTADGTYYNMPIAPVTGQANLREFIHNFLKSWEKTDWEILNIVSQGDLVIAERVDRTVVGDRKVDLPCVGVFEMQDGKIAVWRDYFDLATFTKGAEPTGE